MCPSHQKHRSEDSSHRYLTGHCNLQFDFSWHRAVFIIPSIMALEYIMLTNKRLLSLHHHGFNMLCNKNTRFKIVFCTFSDALIWRFQSPASDWCLESTVRFFLVPCRVFLNILHIYFFGGSSVGAVVRALAFHHAMWPGFDLRTWRQMWIEFVGSLLCSERFFPLTKNQHLICVDLNSCLPN